MDRTNYNPSDLATFSEIAFLLLGSQGLYLPTGILKAATAPMSRATPTNSNDDEWNFSDIDDQRPDSSARYSSEERQQSERLLSKAFANTGYRFSNSLLDFNNPASHIYLRSSNSQYQAAESSDPARHSKQLHNGSEDPRLSNQWCSQLEDPRSSSHTYSELDNPRSSNVLYSNDAHSSLVVSTEVDQRLQLRNEDQMNSKEQHTNLPALYPYLFEDPVRELEFHAKREAYRNIESSIIGLCEVALRAISSADTVLFHRCHRIVHEPLYHRLRPVYAECERAYQELQRESELIRQQGLFSGEIDDAAVRQMVQIHAKLAFQTYLKLVAAVGDEKHSKSYLPEFLLILRPLHKRNCEAENLIQNSPWCNDTESIFLESAG